MPITLRLEFPTTEACQSARRALLESGIAENAITGLPFPKGEVPHEQPEEQKFEVSPEPAVSEGAEHTPESTALGIALGGAIGAAVGAAASPVVGPLGVAAGIGVGAYTGSLVGALSGFEPATDEKPTDTALEVQLENEGQRADALRVAQLFGAVVH